MWKAHYFSINKASFQSGHIVLPLADLTLYHTLTHTHGFLHFPVLTLTDTEMFSSLSLHEIAVRRIERWRHRGVILSVNTALWSVFMAEVETSQLQEVYMFREVVTSS